MELKNNDKTLLKTILLDFLKPWMQEKPDVRTQKYICLKCPAISQSKLSRVLDENSSTCPTFEETVELIMFIDKPEALDRFIRNSKSTLSQYLVSLKNWKGDRVHIDYKEEDQFSILQNINDGLSVLKQEFTWRQNNLVLVRGMILGLAFGFVLTPALLDIIYYFKDYFLKHYGN